MGSKAVLRRRSEVERSLEIKTGGGKTAPAEKLILKRGPRADQPVEKKEGGGTMIPSGGGGTGKKKEVTIKKKNSSEELLRADGRGTVF